jgi:hypothetical protein
MSLDGIVSKGEPIELSGGVRGADTHRPDQAASHQGRAAAVRAAPKALRRYA